MTNEEPVEFGRVRTNYSPTRIAKSLETSEFVLGVIGEKKIMKLATMIAIDPPVMLSMMSASWEFPRDAFEFHNALAERLGIQYKGPPPEGDPE